VEWRPSPAELGPFHESKHSEGLQMRTLNERTIANMVVALEEVCRDLPHGGDHELRKQIANKLIQSAMEGNTKLGGLTLVARGAFLESSSRKSA
jgi:hypothetical protein